MGLVINTNQSSLMIQRNLSKTTSELGTYMERLSTGLRINSATDDAAGLALSEKLKTQIDSSDVVKNNIQTGVNMIQVAEADMAIIQENLQRMRDLTVQSLNGVYADSDTERNALHAEFVQRRTEIARIAASSEFSGIDLLDGSNSGANSVVLQVGTNNVAANDRLDISAIFAGLADTDLGINADTIATAAGATTTLGHLDTAIGTVSTNRATAGAMVNRLTSTLDRVDVRKENMASAYSVIRDADVAVEAANLTRVQILQQSAASLLQQANQAPSLALSLL